MKNSIKEYFYRKVSKYFEIKSRKYRYIELFAFAWSDGQLGNWPIGL